MSVCKKIEQEAMREISKSTSDSALDMANIVCPYIGKLNEANGGTLGNMALRIDNPHVERIVPEAQRILLHNYIDARNEKPEVHASIDNVCDFYVAKYETIMRAKDELYSNKAFKSANDSYLRNLQALHELDCQIMNIQTEQKCDESSATPESEKRLEEMEKEYSRLSELHKKLDNTRKAIGKEICARHGCDLYSGAPVLSPKSCPEYAIPAAHADVINRAYDAVALHKGATIRNSQGHRAGGEVVHLMQGFFCNFKKYASELATFTEK